MIKVERIDTWGFEHAIRGMRNPMNSWDKSDSAYCMFDCEQCWLDPDGCKRSGDYVIGARDLELMQKLYKASLSGNNAHRKFMRQIFVSMDVTAPLYWWKQADQYKVGTCTNSCSTMHRLTEKPFEYGDFSCEHLWMDEVAVPIGNGEQKIISPYGLLNVVIRCLNEYRLKYLETKDKKWWWQIIQLLPESYNQKRTLTMSYETVAAMIIQRTNHKLDEWKEFIKILIDLPYIREILGDTMQMFESTD